MAEYKRPGSYVEETTFGSKPTAGVTTSVAGFVGVTRKGDLLNPIECNSWNEYVEKCGERQTEYNTGYCVYGYFQNGGKKAYISRATHYSGDVTTALSASATIKDRTNTSNTLKIEGVNEGTWANNLSVTVEKATSDLPAFSYLRTFDASTGTYTSNDTKGKYENIYKVFTFNGSSFTDKTTDARTESPSAYNAFNALGDYLVVASKYDTFGHVTFDTANNASCATGVVVAKYWNGLGWQTIPLTTNDLSIGTAPSFAVTAGSNYDVVFTAPSDWKKCELNSVLAYWVKFEVTTGFTVAVPQVKKIQINPPTAGADKQFDAFPASIDTGDSLYVGSLNTKFDALELDLQVVASGGTPVNVVEYWNGNIWKELTVSESTAGVLALTVNGTLLWTIPTDWARTTVNSNIAYWIRIKATTVPGTTNPTLYSVLSIGSKFKLTVKENGLYKESFDNLSMISSNKNYVEARINEGIAKSKYIKATVQTNNLADKRPDLVVDTALTGGGDGLDNLVDIDYTGSSTLKTGLYRFDAKKDVRFITIPDEVGNADVESSGVDYCENRMDCYYFSSPEYGKTPAEVKLYKQTGGNFESSFGGMYYPHGKVIDPVGAGDQPRKWIPLVGHQMGRTATVHETLGVNQACGGDVAQLIGVIQLEREINEEDQGMLNEVNVNCIINDDQYGIVTWGARNMITTDIQWRYQSSRLLTTYIRNTLLARTKFAVLKPNNPSLWNKLYTIAYQVLDPLYKSGALFDGDTGKVENAYFIVCDGTLNTREVVNAGKIYLQAGFCITKPGEFVILTIGQWDGGSVVKESQNS